MFFKIKSKIALALICIIVIIYFVVNFTIGNDKISNLKLLLSNEKRQLIKKYIFPYKLISEQEIKIYRQTEKINKQNNYIDERNKKIISQNHIMSQLYSKLELLKIKEGSEIETSKYEINLSDNLILKKFKFNSGFYAGIWRVFPGSGYIDFHNNNIIVVSARGILTFKKNITDDNENFKQIRNSINEFININQFKKKNEFSIKDLLIFKNKIYISYTNEVREDCWNTGIIYGNMNYENIKFKELFLSKQCIHSRDNIDKEFNAHQSGGRMISFDKNHILFSTGDYVSRHLAQNKSSINGKILKINIQTLNYEIISMGHRNPQGLNFDKENNFILETEHGPMGGDEINLIEVSKINTQKILNYGWPISSAGEHYGGKEAETNRVKYEKYPLYNSHKKYGFIEPLKSFVPSIGISEIAKISKNKYVVSSLKDKSLYFFELNKQKKIFNIKRVELFERVRDLKFKNDKLYLFLENSASIGVINLTNN